MRIAVFIKSTTFHKGFGGLESQNKVLCEGLAGRGNEIVVYSPIRELEKEKEFEKGVEYKFIKADYYKYLLAFLNKNSWVNKSYDVFKKDHEENPFDIVISQSAAASGIIRKKKILDIPVISIAHGTTLGEFKTYLSSVSIKSLKDIIMFVRNTQYFVRQYFGRQREYILLSDHVIAVSNAVKKQLIEETFVPEDRVTVINNGINPEKFISLDEKLREKGQIELEKLNLIYVGQVIKNKGIDILIEIFKDSQFKDITLDIFGGGEYLQELKDLIIQNSLSKQVRAYGKIPYERIIEVYNNPKYDAFVFPTKRFEGLPMVLVEALFAGLPIVAFDIGGVSDVVKNGETGFLIESENVFELKQKILSLKNNRETLSELRKSAFNKAQRDFGVDAMLNKYEKIMKPTLLKEEPK